MMSQLPTKKYLGNCHCGIFKSELEVPEIKTVSACKCSLCNKKGYLFVSPTREHFKIFSGEGKLIRYEFADKKSSHEFCSVCGTGVLVRRKFDRQSEEVKVNVRAFLDINPFNLEVQAQECEGAAYDFTPPIFTGELPKYTEEEAILYTGSCHCTAVQLAVQTKPLSHIQIKEDNCSICQRNANICIYPNQSQVSIQGEENLTDYRFGRKFTTHRFCKICGVQMYMKMHGPPKEVLDSWPEAKKMAVGKYLEICPVRVRVLDGVDVDNLNVERSDEGTEDYEVAG